MWRELFREACPITESRRVCYHACRTLRESHIRRHLQQELRKNTPYPLPPPRIGQRPYLPLPSSTSCLTLLYVAEIPRYRGSKYLSSPCFGWQLLRCSPASSQVNLVARNTECRRYFSQGGRSVAATSQTVDAHSVGLRLARNLPLLPILKATPRMPETVTCS